MFKKNKIEVIPWDEFFDGDWREKKAERKKQAFHDTVTKLSGIGAVSSLLFSAESAHASVGVGDVVMRAFDPIVDLLQGISYPVAFIMISGGFLLIMTGQTSRGMHFIKWACLGYLGLQFAPALMKIVITIGQNIQTEVGMVG